MGPIMALFDINKEKCVKCGACAEVCPVQIISFNKEKGPKPVKWAEKVCIDCGHCVCVCPKDALSHRSMSPDECLLIEKKLEFTPEQTEQFLRCRRSIRVYQNISVSKKLLTEVIRVASHAPTGHNLQDVSWKVMMNKDEVNNLRDSVIEWMKYLVEENSPLVEVLNVKSILLGHKTGYDVILRGAPHVVVAHAHKDDRIAPSSCTIALTYLDLAATSFGLGTCWAGFLDLALSQWPPAQVVLDLPADHVSLGSLMIGYPKHTYKRMPKRKKPEITWE